MKGALTRVLLWLLRRLGVEVILPCDSPGAGPLCMKSIRASVTLRNAIGTHERRRAIATDEVARDLAIKVIAATKFVERPAGNSETAYEAHFYVIGTPGHLEALGKHDPNRIAGKNTILDSLFP